MKTKKVTTFLLLTLCCTFFQDVLLYQTDLQIDKKLYRDFKERIRT